MIFRKPATVGRLANYYGPAIDRIIAARLIAVRSSADENLDGCTRILVAGSEPRVGRTTTAMGMALASAQSRRKQQVLLVDLDFRNSSLTKKLRLHEHAGAREVISGSACLTDVVCGTSLAHLSVVGCGRSEVDLPDCFGTVEFHELLKDIGVGFDLAIFDSPPMNDYEDAKVLAGLLDAAALVTRTEKTNSDELMAANRALQNNLAGVIVNAYKDPVPSFLKRWV